MKKITLLMKTSVYACCAFVFLSSTISLSQTNRVLVKVDWPSQTYEQKAEVYDPANNLLASNSIKAVELTNIAEGQEIYLRDNLTNTYFDLRSETAYNFTSEAGLFTDRFDIVFKAAETLGAEEFKTENRLIYVNQLEDKLYVKALTNQAKQLSITNMLGQVVKSYNSVNNQTLENGFDISNLSSGVYVVSVQTENSESIDKKVIIN